MGPACDKPVCPQGCVNGNCTGPNTCVCQPGWQGAACDQCVVDPFSVDASGAYFTFDSWQLEGCHWKPGVNATLIGTGTTTKQILAGTVLWHLYEDGAQHFVAEGDRDYFVCTNKGCDPSEPLALDLADPSSANTNFTLTFSFVMPNRTASGSFRLVAYGQDQDHAPYDFSATLSYNFTSTRRSEGEGNPGWLGWW